MKVYRMLLMIQAALGIALTSFMLSFSFVHAQTNLKGQMTIEIGQDRYQSKDRCRGRYCNDHHYDRDDDYPSQRPINRETYRYLNAEGCTGLYANKLLCDNSRRALDEKQNDRKKKKKKRKQRSRKD